MLVFGGNSHNGTVQSQSMLPCFSMDFLAYDIGELNQVSLLQYNNLFAFPFEIRFQEIYIYFLFFMLRC